MEQIELPQGEKCSKHKSLNLGYIDWHSDSERRVKRGMKQKQCKNCKHWFWSDEM